ncbi:expressed protein [Phakopsora pachyrhizi]|uniref:Expressed protein n=1 Tax=Phakopsora pachyrhizi TaxID=170000 RepID=A0AAV0B403_PHAPC|nr:expressed protein [Phakopsora pachyrhizi]
MVWDLNRALLSEGTGDIATCSHNTVRIWSVNGDLLTTLVTTQHNTEPITACCWSKAEVSPLFVTGHQGGKMIFWQRRSVHAENPTDPWKMTVIHVFEHDSGRNDFRGPTAICSLVMTERLLLSGDTLGRLFCWALPGSAYYLPDSAASNCMICDHRFGILDGKRRCVSCSAITCSSCQDIVSGLSGKCCLDCVPNLMKLASSS